jgi:hypothetical protein
MRLDHDMRFTISPSYDHVPDQFSKFRWQMHLSLPYPFPSRKCVQVRAAIASSEYAVSIHNHFNRVVLNIQASKTSPMYFKAILEEKKHPAKEYPGCVSFVREALPSVVRFEEQKEYASPNDAFAKADSKVKNCADWLAEYLGTWQREAPYLETWHVYPVTLFELGTIYHEVHGFCTKHNCWEAFGTAVTSSPGRSLSNPTFFMEAPRSSNPTTALDTANEFPF